LKTSIFCIVLLCLAALVVAACAGSSTPQSIADNSKAPPLTVQPIAAVKTETPHPTVAPATDVPSPTVPKPTATFVPLITPSATATGDQPSRATVLRIGVADARALAEGGDAILVDVRSRGTYEQAHIAGALSVPLDEVAERAQELAEQAHKLGDEALIIFYCA
jgi:hypothetical protein